MQSGGPLNSIDISSNQMRTKRGQPRRESAAQKLATAISSRMSGRSTASTTRDSLTITEIPETISQMPRLVAFNVAKWMEQTPKGDLSDLVKLLPFVQQEERARIKRFYFEIDSRRAFIGRLVLRWLLVHGLGLSWNEITLLRSDANRPILASTIIPKTAFDFNMSHHGEWVVGASHPTRAIGVDIMDLSRPRGDSVQAFFTLMDGQFTAHEWKQIRAGRNGLGDADDDGQLYRFYQFWCLKESFIKATGDGLSFGLKRLSFTIPSAAEISSNIRAIPSNALRRASSFAKTGSNVEAIARNAATNASNGATRTSKHASITASISETTASISATTASICAATDSNIGTNSRTPAAQFRMPATSLPPVPTKDYNVITLTIDGDLAEGWDFYLDDLDNNHVYAVAYGPVTVKPSHPISARGLFQALASKFPRRREGSRRINNMSQDSSVSASSYMSQDIVDESEAVAQEKSSIASISSVEDEEGSAELESRFPVPRFLDLDELLNCAVELSAVGDVGDGGLPCVQSL